MGIRDSRNTVQLPRWGVSGETVDADVIEPPGAQKDSGWVPQVDRPVAEWMNWLASQTYLFLAYLESILERRWDQNHVMRSAKGTTACEVTAGVGLSVNVVLGHVWIQGDMYEVPAATNLALAAADATNPRYDMIVARVTAGVPAYAVVTGTPAASPAEPAVGAADETVARVRVNALAVAPSIIGDRRVYGRLGLASLKVDTIANLGDVGGSGDHMIEVDASTGGGIVYIAKVGNAIMGDGLFSVLQGAAQVLVDAEAVQFVTPITRSFDVGLGGWSWIENRDNFLRKILGGGELLEASVTPSNLLATVRIPDGATITTVRVKGWRTTNVDTGIYLELREMDKNTGAVTVLASDSNDGIGLTGNFTITIASLALVVDQDNVYELEVHILAAAPDTCGIRTASIEYTETKPFDGL